MSGAALVRAAVDRAVARSDEPHVILAFAVEELALEVGWDPEAYARRLVAHVAGICAQQRAAARAGERDAEDGP